MKRVLFYLLLVIAVPATAQTGIFGPRTAHSRHITNGQHSQGPLFNTGHHHHYPAPPMETLGMNPRDYDDAVRIISEENFDEKRLDVAKRIVTSNPMSARQIANICKIFSFEANRLEFAKYAYGFCVDRNKYFLVEGTFNFSASKDELNDYISQIYLEMR